MKLAPHTRRLVLGVTGSGKSHYTAHEIVSREQRVIVWDPHGEYADAGPRPYGVAWGVTLDEFCGMPPRALAARQLHLSVRASWDDDEDLADAFVRWASHVKAAVRGAVLIIEECALLVPRAQRRLAALATQARHWGCAVVMVAQRAVHITPSARAQASEIVSFRQSHQRDIEALAEIMGDKAHELASLPRRRSLTWREADAFAS